MKKITLFLVSFSIAGCLFSQELNHVTLNKPDLNREGTVMQALQKRASASSFSSEPLSLQDLSDLLWAASGVNRPESGKRTAPSAIDARDVDIYVFLENGIYIYDVNSHVLNPVIAGDYRSLVAGRQPDFASAAAFLLMVSDISRFRMPDDSVKMTWGAMDAAIISQNISVFCASAGLNTRPRAFMETEKLKEILKLTDTQYPMLNNPVGYSR